MSKIKFEIAIDNVASALAVQKSGADSIELCAGLSEGGTTPSVGMIRKCRELLDIKIFVMIRPRRGDFLFSEPEIEVMLEDIAVAKEEGADGVVIGLLQPNGEIDVQNTKRLVAAARPMSVTFHRAFDMTPDPVAAIQGLKACGVDRVLTSGQQVSAAEGIELIKILVKEAGDELVILPGGGITLSNLDEILVDGVKEIHATAAERVESLMESRNEWVDLSDERGISEYEHVQTMPSIVNEMKKVLDTGYKASL